MRNTTATQCTNGRRQHWIEQLAEMLHFGVSGSCGSSSSSSNLGLGWLRAGGGGLDQRLLSI
jgi:hypothetical protein